MKAINMEPSNMWRISQTIAVIVTIFLAVTWAYYGQVSLKEKALALQKSHLEAGPKPVVLKEEQWKKILTPDEYHILREKGTEPAYSGKYWDHKEEGVYHCRACDLPLFSSKSLFKIYDQDQGFLIKNTLQLYLENP